MPEELQSPFSEKSKLNQSENASSDSQRGINGTEKKTQTSEAAQNLEQEHQLPAVTGIRRLVYLLLAALFFILGAIGAVLPGLPTTPFLLLTSFFLVRTSPKLNALLLKSPVFGPILRDWQERQGVRRDVKFQAIFIVSLLVGLSIYFIQPNIVIVGIVCLGAVIGIWVILRLPEIPSDNSNVHSKKS